MIPSYYAQEYDTYLSIWAVSIVHQAQKLAVLMKTK